MRYWAIVAAVAVEAAVAVAAAVAVVVGAAGEDEGSPPRGRVVVAAAGFVGSLLKSIGDRDAGAGLGSLFLRFSSCYMAHGP